MDHHLQQRRREQQARRMELEQVVLKPRDLGRTSRREVRISCVRSVEG